MKKWLRISLRIVLLCVALLMLAWGILYGYFLNHKQELIQRTTEQVNGSISSTLSIEDAGLSFPSTFPYVSIELENISLIDSMYLRNNKKLVEAEKLRLLTNPFKLLTGKLEFSKVELEKGSIYLLEDSTGYNSLESLKSEKAASETQNGGLKKTFTGIRLINMQVTIAKPVKSKLYSFDIRDTELKMDHSGANTEWAVKTNMLVRSLAFNTDKGSLLENKPLSGKFKLQYDTVKHEISFENIELEIDKETYQFSGAFRLSDDKLWHLHVDAPKANFKKTISLLARETRQKLDSFSLDKTVAATADITGLLQPDFKPTITVNWNVSNTNVTTPYGLFEHATFKGYYHNKVSDTLPAIGKNSIIKIEDFHGNWRGIPLQSKSIAVENLASPLLTCDIKTSTDMSTLNDALNSESLEFTKGIFDVDIIYSGPLADTSTQPIEINGVANIKDATMLYGPRQIQLDDFNGELLFKGTDVYLNNIETVAQGNPVKMNITALNLGSFINNSPDRAQLNAQVYAPEIDIDKFGTFLGSRRRPTKKTSLKSATTKIDRLLEQCTIQSTIEADKIIFKRLVANNFHSNIFLSNREWKLNNTSFNMAGGTISLSGSIKEGQNDYNPVSLKATMRNLDVARTFYAFNNFGLSSLSSKNLDGKLSSDINMSAALKDKAELVPSSLKGSVSLSLKEGGINNWEPLESMSIFLLKNRDFSHVSFSEIRNRFDFDKKLIKINRMEIESSVLALYMEGIYDTGGKQTDLSLQIPLSNLKKRKADWAPDNKNDKPGPSVYVLVKNKDNGDIDFNFSLTNKRKR